jgi:signal transduction histidine kinase
MMEVYITQLIEPDVLQTMQNIFTQISGVTAIITDNDGSPMALPENFLDAGEDLHPLLHRAASLCQLSGDVSKVFVLEDAYVLAGDDTAEAFCLAVPITAGSKLIGCFVAGQYRLDATASVAVHENESGADAADSLLSHVKVCSRQTVDSDRAMLRQFAKVLSQMAYHHYILKESVHTLKDSLKTHSALLSDISHDIRTPLQRVVQESETGLLDSGSSELSIHFAKIFDMSRNALSYLDDTLDYVKINEGKMGVHEMEYRVEELVDDLGIRVEHFRQNEQVSFDVDIQPEVPELLYGDVAHIKQILYNLVTNALKFTKEGSVTIVIGMEKRLYGMDLRLTVQDTGVGMKPEQLAQIRGILEKSKDIPSKQGHTTNLGLRVTKRLVDILYGDVDVASTDGVGTTFWVRIPQLAVGEV